LVVTLELLDFAILAILSGLFYKVRNFINMLHCACCIIICFIVDFNMKLLYEELQTKLD